MMDAGMTFLYHLLFIITGIFSVGYSVQMRGSCYLKSESKIFFSLMNTVHQLNESISKILFGSSISTILTVY